MSQAKANQHNLNKMINESEDDQPDSQGSNIETGDKRFRKDKGKQLHSRTQILDMHMDKSRRKSSAGARTKDMTFSGVINMASEFEIRPDTIEVHFKDLTLTLKGKNKHLLRCVTGTLSPGRVSAVMGPSGLERQHFLSALTGKAAAGCTTTGSILINGKSDSIQSYKKVIGYVPQDDIIAWKFDSGGNLWFSARLDCLLIWQNQKVLVVERVIESLGLQQVRFSCGDSGEASSSSQLLLRALRREALEGVVICMVVHQPSTTRQPSSSGSEASSAGDSSAHGGSLAALV
ncbi:hypothetical protein HAX54_009622 [Datura stramonium]|uniref:ABC transporter domain-containing protein n=1 Tax=Datura stramonium TaxID=4076 RepID=A0ABS8TGR9_DATST|nr:hypothetical protein [Datura stramonium]